jgi:hypothetical protein
MSSDKALATARALRHTCILDDGGTPNRRCAACEQEKAVHEVGAFARWRQIEERALYDPVLQRLVTFVRTNEMTREAALIAAVLTLSQQRQDLHDRLLACLEGRTR